MNRRAIFKLLVAAPVAAAAVPFLPRVLQHTLRLEDKLTPALHAAGAKATTMAASMDKQRRATEISREQMSAALHAAGERIMAESKLALPPHHPMCRCVLVPHGEISTPADHVDASCPPYAQLRADEILEQYAEPPTIEWQMREDAGRMMADSIDEMMLDGTVSEVLNKVAESTGIPYKILVGD